MLEPNYPIHYIKPIQLTDGTLIQLRPIHPMDAIQAVRFKTSLSDESIKARFLGYIPTLSEKNIKRLAHLDYGKDMAIIAETDEDEAKKIVGIARIAGDNENEEIAELAVIISDDWHGRKLGTILTDYLIKIAKDLNYQSLFALAFSDNIRMIEILKLRGFIFTPEDNSITRDVLELK